MRDVAEILAQTFLAQISMCFCTFSRSPAVMLRPCDWILATGMWVKVRQATSRSGP